MGNDFKFHLHMFIIPIALYNGRPSLAHLVCLIAVSLNTSFYSSAYKWAWDSCVINIFITLLLCYLCIISFESIKLLCKVHHGCAPTHPARSWPPSTVFLWCPWQPRKLPVLGICGTQHRGPCLAPKSSLPDPGFPPVSQTFFSFPPFLSLFFTTHCKYSPRFHFPCFLHTTVIFEFTPTFMA